MKKEIIVVVYNNCGECRWGDRSVIISSTQILHYCSKSNRFVEINDFWIEGENEVLKFPKWCELEDVKG